MAWLNRKMVKEIEVERPIEPNLDEVRMESCTSNTSEDSTETTPTAKKNVEISLSNHSSEKDTVEISGTDGNTISIGQNCSDETICPNVDKCLTVSDDHVRTVQLQQLYPQDQRLEENSNKTTLEKIANNCRNLHSSFSNDDDQEKIVQDIMPIGNIENGLFSTIIRKLIELLFWVFCLFLYVTSIVCYLLLINHLTN
ncbi:hypothetical protein SNEBB_003920 [Seison nebaliae]|nr:hypothetical protein SNEBB_003920 [Seison nebaliae]